MTHSSDGIVVIFELMLGRPFEEKRIVKKDLVGKGTGQSRRINRACRHHTKTSEKEESMADFARHGGRQSIQSCKCFVGKKKDFCMDSRQNQNDELISEKSDDLDQSKHMLFGCSLVCNQKATRFNGAQHVFLHFVSCTQIQKTSASTNVP